MKNSETKITEFLGEELTLTAINHLAQQKSIYKGTKKDGLIHCWGDCVRSRKLTYQNILSQMIYQSIDNIHSFLDEEDADEFIEMIRSKEIKSKTNRGIHNYAYDFFTTKCDE